MAYKMKKFSGFGNSPTKQKVDPDAPGTPGKPGYEPPVRYEDLDEAGKKLWHKVRKEKKELKKGEDRPEPTWPGTDEYRKPEDIPEKEYKERGIKKSPTKQTQGFGGKGLIKAQKELAQQELAFHQPGWARVASSILPGHDPSAGAKGYGGEGGGAEGTAKGPGGVREGLQEVKGLKKEWGEFQKEWKGSGN